MFYKRLKMQKTFGCCRFVWNHYLDLRKSKYENSKETFSYNKCSQDMTLLKKKLPWLSEVDSTALQSSIHDLDIAFHNFFRRVKNGEKPGYPKFKKKRDHRKSYKSKCVGTNIKLLDGYVQLPKLGLVKWPGVKAGARPHPLSNSFPKSERQILCLPVVH